VVRAVGLGGESGDTRDVWERHGGIVDLAAVLVHNRNVPLGRGQTGKSQEAERLPDTILIPVIV
jgi:hypothetical protein